jgi:tetratricopeptide (TPR) repeat protein
MRKKLKELSLVGELFVGVAIAVGATPVLVAATPPDRQREFLAREDLYLQSLSDSIAAYQAQVHVSPNCKVWIDLARATRGLALGKAHRGLPRESDEFKNLLGSSIEAYNQARTICPDSRETAFGIGSCYSSLGLYSKAIPYFEILSLNDPKDGEALVALAQLNEWLEDWQHSAYWYNRAVSVEGSKPSLRLAYANILDRLGDSDEAERQRQSYLEADKGTPNFQKDKYFELIDLLQINDLLGRAKALKAEGDPNHSSIVALYLEAARRVEEKEGDPAFAKEAAVLSRQLRLAADFYNRRQKK